MSHSLGPAVRDAVAGDVEAICQFGDVHVRAHYVPLIGTDLAAEQVRRWWSQTYVAEGVARGQVVVAEVGGALAGVGQRGRYGDDHVIYKLYVHPDHRGQGLGPLLIAGLVGQLPPGTGRIYIEHLAGNERAGDFYEREGFAVERVEPGTSEATAVVWRVRQLGQRGPEIP